MFSYLEYKKSIFIVTLNLLYLANIISNLKKEFYEI
jgi:hypothetical protein